jgi:hypothetical protein
MGAGSKAHEQDSRCRIAKSGNRPGPILLPAVGPPLDKRDLFAMFNKSGTAKTVDDFGLQANQSVLRIILVQRSISF